MPKQQQQQQLDVETTLPLSQIVYEAIGGVIRLQRLLSNWSLQSVLSIKFLGVCAKCAFKTTLTILGYIQSTRFY